MEFRILAGGALTHPHGGLDVHFTVVAVHPQTTGHGPGIRDRERMGEAGGEADLGLPEAVRIVFIQPIH